MDCRGLFDQEQFSDITITFEHYKWDSDGTECGVYLHEAKCHKVILCHASKFFNAMCGPTTKPNNTERETIVLEDDELCGKANEAVIRHIYNFTYIEIADILCLGTPREHMGVVNAARKYLVPKLEREAVVAIYESIEKEACNLDRPFGARRLAGCVELLIENKEHNAEFASKAQDLTLKHLPRLFKFRSSESRLRRSITSILLDLITKAVERGYQP